MNSSTRFGTKGSWAFAAAMVCMSVLGGGLAASAQETDTPKTLRVGIVGKEVLDGQCLIYISVQNLANRRLEEVTWVLSPSIESGTLETFFSFGVASIAPGRDSARRRAIELPGSANACDVSHVHVEYATACSWEGVEKPLYACVDEMEAYSNLTGTTFGYEDRGT